jgi:hypothetical protein
MDLPLATPSHITDVKSVRPTLNSFIPKVISTMLHAWSGWVQSTRRQLLQRRGEGLRHGGLTYRYSFSVRPNWRPCSKRAYLLHFVNPLSSETLMPMVAIPVRSFHCSRRHLCESFSHSHALIQGRKSSHVTVFAPPELGCMSGSD